MFCLGTIKNNQPLTSVVQEMAATFAFLMIHRKHQHSVHHSRLSEAKVLGKEVLQLQDNPSAILITDVCLERD